MPSLLPLSRPMPGLAALSLCILVGSLTPAPPLFAQDPTRPSLHAFGSWGSGLSDPYPYLTGRGEGEPEFDSAELAVNLSATPVDRLYLVGQAIFQSSDAGEDATVDWAFGEWTFSDLARLRAGRAPLPFGLYTEIFDVGTLRPFFTLPQSLYGPTGLVGKFYSGLGLTGSVAGGSGWGLDYDVYGGGLRLELTEPFEAVVEHEGEGEEGEGEEGEETEEDEAGEADLENLLGARLVVSAPVDGLSFGLSAYAGQPEKVGEFAAPGTKPSFGDVLSYGADVEYLHGPWSIRSEYGLHDEDEFNVVGYYAEVARRLGSHWQVALRFDSAEVEDFVGELPREARSLLEHDEIALGVNYWFTPNWVFKLSYHDVEGNLFAHPKADELLEAVEEGRLQESTELYLFGAQFSF